EKGRMHVSYFAVLDTIKGTAWDLARLAGNLGNKPRRPIHLAVLLGPSLLQANSVTDPPDHGAARRRSLIALARPLVVHAGHFIKHIGTHTVLNVAPGEMEVDDGCEGEPSAGAILTLVENL